MPGPTLKTATKAALGFNFASLIHLARGRPGEFLQGCLSALSAARFPRLTDNLPIPEISLADVLGERRVEISLRVAACEEGVLPPEQALVLASILVAEAPSVVLEIGTFMGSTTRLMAENCPAAVIHTVDLPVEFSPGETDSAVMPKDDFQLISRRVVGRDFAGQPCAARIVQHFADTAEWDFSAAGQPDFYFIDGSHTYEYCRNDSEKCHELCGGKGVFLWHDCDRAHPGVVRCLSEWRALGRDVRRISGTPLAYWKGI